MPKKRTLGRAGSSLRATPAGRILAIYFLAATVAIALTNLLLDHFVSSAEDQIDVRAIRTLVIVAMSAVLLFIAFHREFRAREGMADDLHRVNRALEGIARIGERRTVGRPLHDALGDLLGAAAESVGGDLHAVYVRDGTGRFDLTASCPNEKTGLPGVTTAAGTLIGAVLQRAETIQVPDTTGWEGGSPPAPGYRSWVIAPLNVSGSTVGVLAAARREPGAFPRDAMVVVQVLSERMASIVETARLEQAEFRSRIGAEHARRQLSLLALGSRALVESVDDYETPLSSLTSVLVPDFADWCAIDLNDEGAVRRLASAHRDPARTAALPEMLEAHPGWVTPIQRVMATGRSELVFDVSGRRRPGEADDVDHRAMAAELGMESCVIVPIRVQGLSFGAITCATARGRRGYRPSDVAALEELSDRAAMAIERVSLYRATAASAAETTARAAQLRRLMEAALAVHARLTSAEVAQVVADQARRVLGTRRALVQYGKGTDNLRATSTDPSMRRQLDEELTDLLTSDATQGWSIDALDGGPGADGTWLASPLNDRRGRATGVLLVADKEGGALDANDRSILVSLAQMASVAIENARLYESLLRNEERLQALVDASPLAIIEVDLEGTLRRSNTAARALFGWAEDALDPLAFHPTTLELVRRMAEDTVAGDAALNEETVIWRTDGLTVPISAATAVLRDPDGDVDGVLLMAADISSRKQLEQQLLRAQRMEAVGQVAGGVAHDFNNLLTVILGRCELLLAGMEAGNEHRPDVEAIREAGERAAGVSSQLLTISRGELTQADVFDARARIDGLVPTLRRLLPESIAMRVEGPEHAGMVRMAPGQFDQIVLNLSVNACDAMPNGGHLTVAAETGSDELVLRVSDDGMGMDASVAARCFEPFFTTKGRSRGTGLGLATVYSIVTSSGGTIDVASVLGEGTTFTLRLPLVDEPATTVPADDRPVARGGTERVLLVEDERDLRMLAAEILTREGYVVIPARDGEEALHILETDVPDVVVTDIVMPRLGGLELVQRLHEVHPDVPVVFMSGYADRVHSDELVGAALLVKPFRPNELAAKVRELLDHAHGPLAREGQGSNR